ncbi:TPA: DUF1642 domain-containing protein [Streptococcus suis]|uniref:DUF1642 domain-containing protein n=1 Tax=Streptococcus suis TaxID=1307 RepID=UPI00209BAA49|nr:DUF1642 domain-containing protein [Streptococcus suis]MCO8199367.1 DUF1642 domain-containing protein [Streptococcus suis]MCO8208461.1 DUF1642 domain-containing protein [Streptococcus suis]MCO8217077.1 DUF1642 domain-containing protein [Streptococcus suis]HEM3468831.1 DUF1642 domain-containing protein [Streptococcus suis]HEM3479580.1 DUF1642 domain-containing protein [Streptococcus suis]
MNKQEAIEKIKEHGKFYSTVFGGTVKMVPVGPIIDIISQIHEPQKVVVPKFVAEWLKEYRYVNTLLKVLNAAEDERIVPSAVNDWILDNQRDFVMAWYNGYEAEQEQLYTVEIPDPNSYLDYRYLSRNDNGICLYASNDTKWKQEKRNQFTKAEIKQDFEWAWQWAEPVEVE